MKLVIQVLKYCDLQPATKKKKRLSIWSLTSFSSPYLIWTVTDSVITNSQAKYLNDGYTIITVLEENSEKESAKSRN